MAGVTKFFNRAIFVGCTVTFISIGMAVGTRCTGYALTSNTIGSYGKCCSFQRSWHVYLHYNEPERVAEYLSMDRSNCPALHRRTSHGVQKTNSAI